MADDKLPLCRMQASDRDDYRFEKLDLSAPRRFRVVLGPQDDHFPHSAVKTFFESEFIVSAATDRIGMRLTGPSIMQNRDANFTSDGTATGSIQVTGSGQLIVLLPDRQTTGGYPKIATIVSADLPALGRLSIGTKIAFEPVTMEVAQMLRRELLALMNGLPDKLVRVPPTQVQLRARLPACNLISGVIDGRTWNDE
jgi:allophanate hydrolase subunit 2